MTVKDVAAIDLFAQKLGIKVLWAGGITLPQAFVLGRLGVFGIYVTSAASSPAPVPPDYARDPWLSAVKEPTYEGVTRAKLLLEAGFLSSGMKDARIETHARRLISDLQEENEKKITASQNALSELLVDSWKIFAGMRAARKN